MGKRVKFPADPPVARPIVASKTRRVWVPSSALANTAVMCWTWTRRDGLWCHFSDGISWVSEYGHLKYFLKAVKEGREVRVRELTAGEQVGG